MNKPKKILFVITKGNFGGAQRYVYDLATHISNATQGELEAIVVFGEGATLGEKLKEMGVRTISIKSLKRNVGLFSDIASFFALWGVIRKEEPEVVHLNSSKVGLLGTIIVRLTNIFRRNGGKIKSVFTAHGWAFNEERSSLSKLIILKLHWWTVLLSHRTIAVSRRTKDQIAHLPFMERKITVVYNGIEPFSFKTQSEARMALSSQSVERLWVGTVSELHRNKGLDLLIQSFAPLMERYANVILVIIGGGEQEKGLRALCASLGIEHKVIFAGFKPDARTYLSAFDIFTLTSRTEAFPYAPLEAGMAHLPVVASWTGGIPEVIDNNGSGILVDPHDREKLTAALDDLIAKKELRTELGEALYKKVTEDFMLETMIEKTIKQY